MKKSALISLLAIIALVFTAGIGMTAEPVTIQGQVTEDSQLMTADGEFYEIADNDEGMKVMEMVGEQIEVRGTVVEDEGVKEITVESFSIVQ
jgi:hypothetical protein